MLTQPITPGDTVEYHGSITEYHGTYTVTHTHVQYNTTDGETRYGIQGGPASDTITNVRRSSITLVSTEEKS